MNSKTDTEDFNVIQFEKKLSTLKDSQESINACCQWCLSNRQHHKKIVNSWLNVLKRVKVEHRLILFYLANDVIQYSKRKKYDYVESWGTALQKATTLVRDERVKQKIMRIFKIWQDRGVYNEEFTSDLCGLINVTPAAPPKHDEPHEFQSSFVIGKIRKCSNLEDDTDSKLKKLKQVVPKILETDTMFTSLKDRAHLDDTEKELDTYATYMEQYIEALKAEVKNRITLISVLKQAEIQLEVDRKDVKIVANAYKTFGSKVKTFQKKLQQLKVNLSSPIPSPDVNAPSPTSDSDIDLLPDEGGQKSSTSNDVDISQVQITNANYYNPVQASTDSQFVTNGFTSFIGSNISFDNFNFGSNASTSLISNPINSSSSATVMITGNVTTAPLLPPPMPPFGTKEETNFTSYETGFVNETDYGFNVAATSYSNDNNNFDQNYYVDTRNDSTTNLFVAETSATTVSSFEPPIGANPYPPNDIAAEYNPEEELQTWEGDISWTQPPTLDSKDTPESPPPFEKEAYGYNPIECHDNIRSTGDAIDIDHRILPSNLGRNDEHVVRGSGQDVDHRNLINLIGSPAATDSNPSSTSDLWTSGDQDYRLQSARGDRDYRLPLDIEQQLKLPPPPPPPSRINHKKHSQDNVESIDMELSDDETQLTQRDNLRVVVDGASIGTLLSQQQQSIDTIDSCRTNRENKALEPPPPLPELPDDADENMFLEQMSNNLDDFLFNQQDVEPSWNNNLPPPPPPIFSNAIPPPPLVPNWMGEPPPSSYYQFNNGPSFQSGCESGGGGGGGGGGVKKRGKFVNRGMRGGNWGNYNYSNSNNNNNQNNRNGGNHFKRGGGRGNNSRGNFRGRFRGNRGNFS